MQNARDSFYIVLRDRLAAVNPLRALTIRAVQRPGILIEDAEAPMAELPNDVFVLRWTALSLNENLPITLASMECEIHYATSGTQSFSGLDRGRALTEMDHELNSITKPWCVPKMRYTSTPAVALNTKVFWTAPVFTAANIVRNQISRVAKMVVLSFEEPGEL